MQQHSKIYLRKMKKRKCKEILSRIFIVAIVVAGVISGVALSDKKEVPKAKAESVTKTDVPETVAETDQAGAGNIEKTKSVTKTSLYFNANEEYLLAKIAMVEAEGEDTEGKALVILTVLNRVKSESFPNTIAEVIYEKGQFTPISNCSFDNAEPSTDCFAALDLVKSGWDESQEALYFERTTDKSTWHNRNLAKLFTHGNHTFYTEVATK